MTSEFSFSFGTNNFGSGYDLAATKLYEALGNKKKEVDLMEAITSYFKDCFLQDDKLEWKIAQRKKALL